MIPLFKVHMPLEVDEPLLKVLHSGYITQGEQVEDFERKLGELINNPYVASVNSGTSALTLALRLANVGPGDEVITTAMTCTATNLPILSLGATPVFADVDQETGLISPKSVKRLVSSKTKAVMAVDWGGLPVDVRQLENAVYAEGGPHIPVIVDAAHAIGTVHNDTPDFLCYSFQAIKHITTVDGGALVCKTLEDYHRAKVLRWFGIDREAPSTDTRIDQDIEEWGYKFHMNDVAATIGLVQLKFLPQIVEEHQQNAAIYLNEISDWYKKPPFEGTFWLYTLLLPTKILRDKFKKFMLENGVQVSQVHKRNDVYKVFQPFANEELFGTGYFASRMICIPVHWGLTVEEREKIINLCNQFAEENKE